MLSGSPVNAPTITNNAYHNYAGSAINSGGSYSDANPVSEDPQLSCWVYNIASGSPVFSSPVSFPGLPGGWGPPASPFLTSARCRQVLTHARKLKGEQNYETATYFSLCVLWPYPCGKRPMRHWVYPAQQRLRLSIEQHRDHSRQSDFRRGQQHD
ncbi:MAG: hypothetical protein USCAAHI_02720 [Beijerinckiaceae bacterium]|nr:MAG: hypothetical protein USCAAHI_02720 [Beijerinckiaceae bacterium]